MSEQTKRLYPLTFSPIAVHTTWGGKRLSALFKKTFVEQSTSAEPSSNSTPDSPIGESLEIADLGYAESVVKNGWLAGNSLDDILETYLDRIVGDHVCNRFVRLFPVSVKWLDVQKTTPLMVCPNDEIAEQRYDSLGKTKFWYIADAQPGARLFLGFKRDVSAAEFYSKCMDGSIEELLNIVEPHKGDSFLIRPGIVHAAGNGVLIAEIAESSNLDMNICSWEQASDEIETAITETLDFVNLSPCSKDVRLSPIHPTDCHDHCCHEDEIAVKLVDELQFTLTGIRLKDALHIYTESLDSFIIYLCTEGEASIQIPEDPNDKASKMENHILKAGETILIPAEVPDFFIVPRDRNTVLLETVIGKSEEEDEYIDPTVEATVDGDFDDEEDEEMEALLSGKSCSCGHHHEHDCCCDEDGDGHECHCGHHHGHEDGCCCGHHDD